MEFQFVRDRIRYTHDLRAALRYQTLEEIGGAIQVLTGHGRSQSTAALYGNHTYQEISDTSYKSI